MRVAGVLVGGVQCKLVPVACVSVLCGGGVCQFAEQAELHRS